MRSQTTALAILLAPLVPACGGGPVARLFGRGSAFELASGTPRADALELPGARSRAFAVTVPEEAVSMRVKLLCQETDLALRARFGEPVGGRDGAEARATSEYGQAEMVVDRFSEPALAAGRWYLEVAWDQEYAPRTAERQLARIGFSIEARVFEKRVDGDLAPGEPLAGLIDRDSGGWRTYRIVVPEDAQALRIDLTDVDSDLDLYAHRGEPTRGHDEGEAFSQHFYGRETLVITQGGDPPLAAGTWYVDVVDAIDEDRPSPFRILARLDPEPPAALLAIPPMPVPAGKNPIARALAAVVELSNDSGVGSGTILTPDGWILTNEHVVAALGGAESDELVVSVTVDPHRPPVETFRARAVRIDRDRDLALVRISSGFYGQPLPAGYRFPTVEMGEPGNLSIGDPLWLVGYPTTGGQGSRVTINATRGVVSGFDFSQFGSLIKTDAEITSGNSGGAALDAQGRIVGVPTSTVEHGSGQIGYVHPLTLLPAEWRARIEEGLH